MSEGLRSQPESRPPSVAEGDIECLQLQTTDTHSIAVCTEIENACFSVNERINISAELARRGTLFISACMRLGGEKRCVGYIMILIRSAYVLISKLVVDPSVRRMGIGRSLLLAAVDISRHSKRGLCSLHVEVTNTGAVHLYTSAGFTAQSRHEHFYAMGRHAMSMELEL
jgi:ribosomal protein S18 acetylase RimI-like enzyme